MEIFFEIDSELKDNIHRVIDGKFEEDDGKVSLNSLVYALEELIWQYDNLKEEYDDLERDLQDNYKPISKSEMYGISDSDFY